MTAPRPRAALRRISEAGKQRLCEPLPDAETLLALSRRATFEAYAKHKRYPLRFGLAPFTGRRRDCTFCDDDAGFTPDLVPAIADWMHDGILAGLVSMRQELGDPAFIWAFGNDGWIYEGKLSPGRSAYHGYPLLPTHALAPLIIRRYLASPQAAGRNFDAVRRRYDVA